VRLVYRELRRGKLEASLASRLSAILVNHRVILETVDSEKRIQQLETALESTGTGGKVVSLKANG
jgi:hypothetical protein